MSILSVTTAVATILISILIALCALVLLLMSGANAKPATIQVLKIMCWLIALSILAGTILMIWLLVLKRPWWSALAACIPACTSIALLIVLHLRENRLSEPPPEGFMTPRQREAAGLDPRPSNTPTAHPGVDSIETNEETPMASDKLRAYNERKEAERQEFLKHVEALERAGDLKAMEDAIMKRDNSLWSCCHVAEMYRHRMLRLKHAGDMPGAEHAFARSYDWMCTFASCATSGGEGAANSLARDEHLDQLIRDLGYRPSSVTPWNA